MDSLSYGGVTFDTISTRNWSKKAIFTDDNSDYLYTDNEIEVVILFNPAIVAFTSPTRLDGVSPPLSAPGSSPATTENALKNWFEGPRRQLVIVSGGVEVLRCPDDNYSSDVSTGPKIEARVLPQTYGQSLWPVVLRIKCSTNDRPPAVQLIPPTLVLPVVLANRWKISHDVDSVSRLTIRIIEGDAYFDVGECIRQGVTPDDIREQLLFGVPEYFYRDKVHVSASPDGSQIHYLVIDRERAYGINQNSPARQLRSYSTAWRSGGSVGQAAAQAGFSVPRVVADILAANFSSFISEAGRIFRANLPRYYVNAACECWAGPEVDRRLNIALAMGICIDRIGAPTDIFSTASSEMIVHQAHHENYCRVELTFRFGEESAVIPTFGVGLSADATRFFGSIPGVVSGILPIGARNWINVVAGSDTINSVGFPTAANGGVSPNPVLVRQDAIGTNGPQPCLQPENPGLSSAASNNARGEYIESLVTQALKSATDGVPAAPPSS